jgi:hypothetical protein
MFEIALHAVHLLLQTPPHRDSALAWQTWPPALTDLLPHITAARITPALASDVRALLDAQGDAASPPPRIALQLLAAVGGVLYRGLDVLPVALCARAADAAMQSRELAPLFHCAVQETSRGAGRPFTRLFTRDLLVLLRERFPALSDPLASPLASFSRWLCEAAPNATHADLTRLKFFLEAVRPMTCADFVESVATLIPPLHPAVADVVVQLADTYTDCRAALAGTSASMAFFAGT